MKIICNQITIMNICKQLFFKCHFTFQKIDYCLIMIVLHEILWSPHLTASVWSSAISWLCLSICGSLLSQRGMSNSWLMVLVEVCHDVKNDHRAMTVLNVGHLHRYHIWICSVLVLDDTRLWIHNPIPRLRAAEICAWSLNLNACVELRTGPRICIIYWLEKRLNVLGPVVGISSSSRGGGVDIWGAAGSTKCS